MNTTANQTAILQQIDSGLLKIWDGVTSLYAASDKNEFGLISDGLHEKIKTLYDYLEGNKGNLDLQVAKDLDNKLSEMRDQITRVATLLLSDRFLTDPKNRNHLKGNKIVDEQEKLTNMICECRKYIGNLLK